MDGGHGLSVGARSVVVVVGNPVPVGDAAVAPPGPRHLKAAYEEAKQTRIRLERHGVRVTPMHNKEPSQVMDALRTGAAPVAGAAGAGVARPHDWLVFIGHGDAPVRGEYTLAFVDPGGRTVCMDPSDLVLSLRSAPGMELVLLNGCSTAPLAKRLAVDARVAYAVGWTGKVNSELAAVFGPHLLAAVARRRPSLKQGEPLMTQDLVDASFKHACSRVSGRPSAGSVRPKLFVPPPREFGCLGLLWHASTRHDSHDHPVCSVHTPLPSRPRLPAHNQARPCARPWWIPRLLLLLRQRTAMSAPSTPTSMPACSKRSS